MVPRCGLCGLHASFRERGRREKTAGREWKVAPDGAIGRMPKSAGFRRNPREHAGVGAIGQEKTPTENGWGFIIGGGGGNRTRVRKSSTVRTTCLAWSFGSRLAPAGRQAGAQPVASTFARGQATRPRARADVNDAATGCPV